MSPPPRIRRLVARWRRLALRCTTPLAIVCAALLTGCATTPAVPHVASTGEAAAAEQPFGPRRGDYELGIQGLALSPDVDKGSTKGELAFAYYVSGTTAVALRQFVSHADNGHDTSFLATRVAADFGVTWGRLRPLAGASLGYAYGESVNETVLFGGHVGLRLYLQSATFLQALGGYDLFVTKTHDDTEIFDDGAAIFSLGLGVQF